MILNTVFEVFEDFKYHRELATADGLNVILEFSAKVGTKELKGIDMIRFDEHGKIVEFEVMVRPLSGLQALGEEMGRRLGAYLASRQSLIQAQKSPLTVAGSVGFVCQAFSYSAMSRAAFSFGASAFSAAGAAGAAT